jgi:hypothetical protein
VRVLRALDAVAGIERFGVMIHRWGFFDQRGEMLCQTDLEDLWRDVGPCVGFTRVRLQEVLVAAAAQVPV